VAKSFSQGGDGIRRWHVCGADYTGIRRLRHEPVERSMFEPPDTGFDEYFLFFVENRFLRYQQARINVGHGAGYVIEPGRQTPYSHFPLCTSF
jgi:hypothetical protein